MEFNEKEVKKKIKTSKKRLASLATVLILSGSILPTVQAFAASEIEVNKTGEASVVPEAPVVNISASEVEVQNESEFIDALNREYVDKIILKNDITITDESKLRNFRNTKVNILSTGTKKKINFSNPSNASIKLDTPNADLKFTNVSMTGSNQKESLISVIGENSKLTLDTVEISAPKPVQGINVFIEGLETHLLINGSNSSNASIIDFTGGKSIGKLTIGDRYQSSYDMTSLFGSATNSTNASLLSLESLEKIDVYEGQINLRNISEKNNFDFSKPQVIVKEGTNPNVIPDINLHEGGSFQIDNSNNVSNERESVIPWKAAANITINKKGRLTINGDNSSTNLFSNPSFGTMKLDVTGYLLLRPDHMSTIFEKPKNYKIPYEMNFHQEAIYLDFDINGETHGPQFRKVTGNVTTQMDGTTKSTTNNNDFNKQFSFYDLKDKGNIMSTYYDFSPIGITNTTLQDITTEDTIARGKAEPNATIEIKVGDNVIATGKVDSDGTYSMTIPKQVVGTKVSAVATLDGVSSNVATTTVTQVDLSATTISGLTTDSTTVTGKAEPNATIEIKVGISVIATGKVGSDGHYSLTIPKQKKGTVVQAIATLGGLTSEAKTTVVAGELEPTTISEIYSHTTQVTGKAEPNATIEIKAGDSVIATGKVGSDGNYSLTIKPQAAGTTVVAIATKGSKTSQASTVVKANLVAPVINEYFTTDVYATGTVSGDAKQVAIFVDGVQKRITAVTNGKFSIYSGDLGLTVVGKKFEIAAISGGTVGPKTEGIVKGKPAEEILITVNPYTLNSDFITGTITGVNSKVVLSINGVEKKRGEVKADGTYAVYANGIVTSKDQKVEIIGQGKEGQIVKVEVEVK